MKCCIASAHKTSGLDSSRGVGSAPRGADGEGQRGGAAQCDRGSKGGTLSAMRTVGALSSGMAGHTPHNTPEVGSSD